MGNTRPAHRPKGSRDLRGRCVRVSLMQATRQARVKVATAMRRTRVECNVSVSELAAACAVSRRTVHKWEAARVTVTLGRLRQVAAALGVPVEHLLG